MYSEAKEGNTMTEYEVKFEKQNALTRRLENLYDYVEAESEQAARERIIWMHGEHVEFLHVREFVD